jgi:hypothetical protein
MCADPGNGATVPNPSPTTCTTEIDAMSACCKT